MDETACMRLLSEAQGRYRVAASVALHRREERDAAIKLAVGSGVSRYAIAKAIGVAQSTVGRIVGGAEAAYTCPYCGAEFWQRPDAGVGRNEDQVLAEEVADHLADCEPPAVTL